MRRTRCDGGAFVKKGGKGKMKKKDKMTIEGLRGGDKGKREKTVKIGRMKARAFRGNAPERGV